jgi:hypothetical protein
MDTSNHVKGSWIRRLGVKRIGGQMAFYLLFFAFIGYFADQPEFDNLVPDEALIKLAVRHSGKIIGECRVLDASEIAKLAPNMRAPLRCPREKSPLQVELSLNEKAIFVDSIEPAGMHNDGISAAFERFSVKAGPIHLSVKVNDAAGSKGFSHRFEGDYDLNPADILVVDFDGGFNVQHHSRTSTDILH